MTDTDYQQFLHQKVNFDRSFGFPVHSDELSPILKPHQADIVQWAISGGRRAIFAAFGLGKSLIQLEIMRIIGIHHAGRQLIVCPLGVRQEFIRDARQLLGADITFVRRTGEVGGDGIYITNYESVRDGRLDPALFSAVSLDEASVLRSYGSKTYQTFLDLFDGCRFRFVATATPSPNRYKELIHYAGFLGVMDTGQALTRFFQRDSTQANHLTLYPHKETEFWLWLNTWAVFLQRPSDLGYPDTGYDLPELDVRWHEIPTPAETYASPERDGQGRLIRNSSLGVVDASREKRDTMAERVAAAKAIVDESPDDHFILWHDLEDERRAITRAIPEAVEVYGAQDLDERESRIIRFSAGEYRILSTKPILAGSGCNFQHHCHRAIFVGVGFKFNDFVQAVHRIHRFQQTRPVRIDIIYAESEREVVQALQTKWEQYKELTEKMSDIIRTYGLNQTAITEALTRSIGVERVEASGNGWIVANNDCVEETRSMGTGSVDLIVTSIPFSNHYEYTPSYNDFGHTDNNDHFWAQMDYLTPELLRVLAPGRLYCCHVKDRILFGNVTGAGYSTVSPFHAEAIMHGRRHGFDYMGMITVVTDVVRENNQSYRLGWSEQCKDGTKMGVGSPEYILLFRKPQTDRSRGYADTPVVKDKAAYTRARWQVDAHAYWRSSGDRHLTPEDFEGLTPAERSRMFEQWTLNHIYDYETHIRIGEHLDAMGVLPATFMSLAPGSNHPDVWHDVNRMLTLNTEQSRRAQTMHVCLARGSLVLTRGGYKPIQEVSVGEHVLTHKGRWRPVLAVQNTGVRPVVELRAQGVPGLTLTPDHKLWARKSDWARARDGAKRAEPQWIEASATVGGYVNTKLPEVETPAVIDERYWWIVGRWLADGHIDQRNVAVISCDPHETDDLLDRLGAFRGNPRDTGTAIQIPLRDPGLELRRTLKACGTGAAHKHLPPEGYTLPAAQAKAMLDGYLSGDGHYLADRDRYTASSVSKELLLGMSILAQRAYGAVASIYPGRPAGECVIEGRTVQTKQDWIFCFDVPNDRRRTTPFIMDDGAWRKVRTADPAGEVETWNLRVEEDESYTAEGCVVKNCPLQFDIVDRLIARYSNPGELVYDPFGGLFTVPVRALRAGRAGRAVELNPDYFADGVRYLQAEEARVNTPSLFDLIDLKSAS
jgi:hypothetical protein